MVRDKYRSFNELSANEWEDIDYRVRLVERNSPIAVFAPHGGLIEPGSCTIAEAIAASTLSLYIFSGCKPSGNYTLHLASTRFDEPRALGMITATRTILTIHGCRGNGTQVKVGGRDHRRVAVMISTLRAIGFAAGPGEPGLAGRHRGNLCNRGTSGMGVQLEISAGLRRQLCANLAPLTPLSGPDHGNHPLSRFVKAVHTAIALPQNPLAEIS